MPPGEDAPQDPPKIIVDSDWKSQAQAEKQKLAEQAKAREAEAAAKAGPAGEAGTPGPNGIPAASFETLLSSIATQALMSLGAFADRRTGQPIPPDLELAKFHIDLLGVLEEKTRGNLSDEEAQTIKLTLQELRTQFVYMASPQAQTPPGQPGAPGTPPIPPGTEHAL
ncbi:DUF1844 domain-containing protein [Mucisphaera sp.]|uniref:DUF1844 domain-containing protein n=1 Tax=Mucisphaera sp. TaxID=2913024 RepID=UPI003D0A7D33